MPAVVLTAIAAPMPISNFAQIFMTAARRRVESLGHDLDLHFHLRVDRALHLGHPDTVERNAARLTGLLGLQIEFHAGRARKDVVRDGVVVGER